MNLLFTVMERFAPEAMEIIETRYRVLRQIIHGQPVGRRQLVKALGYSERTVRGEIDLLRERGAIYTTPAGIYLTPDGEEMLREIDELIPLLFNLQSLADQVKVRFNLDEVILVPGDSFQDPLAKKDLGRAAARYLRKTLQSGSILAVTGGTTLAEMADAIGEGINLPDVLVVPARGGLGEEMEQQAGTIAAKIARAVGGQYRLLHIPDNLEENTAEILKKDMHVARMVDTIKASQFLFHGIGDAQEMASRRGLGPKAMDYLNKQRAVGEALRYYFDEKGNIVYEVPGIGLELTDLEQISRVVAVAGGSNKASAIDSVLRSGKENVLISDEGAARSIIRIAERQE
ncbi:MAG: sugar-binding transcriptional regulator [Deltaproteobacteria bacterium]